MATLARIDGAISARYASRKTILAFDLRNEPTFWMLQSAMYPNGQKPPLLSRKLLERYGEQAANHYHRGVPGLRRGAARSAGDPRALQRGRSVRLPQQLDSVVQALAGGDGLGEEDGPV